MVRLKRLRIDRFRNVRPGTALEFSDGKNVVIGKNGSGKTNLLDLVAMIAQWNFSPLKGEAFSFAYEMEESVGGLRWQVDVESRTPAIKAGPLDPNALWMLGGISGSSEREMDSKMQVRWSDSTGTLIASLGIVQGSVARLTVEAAEVDVGVIDIFQGFVLLSEIRSVAVAKSPQLATRLIPLDWVPFNHVRFDEALEVFRSFVAGQRTEEEHRSRISPAALAFVRASGGLPWRLFASLYPILPTDSGIAEWPAGPEELRFVQSDLPVLQRAARAMGVRSLRLVPRLQRHEAQDGEPEIWIYRGNDLYIRLDPNTEVHHDLLSFGQKRLFAFLWTLACIPNGIVIADELVNGLHHAWVETCLQEIGDRQAILATQNPLLLDYLGFASAEEMRKTFVLCALEPRADKPELRQWVWRNPTEEEAESFFRAYEVGIQHVSEILIDKGLW